MLLSEHQKEFIRESTHRYNIKTGATRSGKTYLDILYTIPSRIRERTGKKGLNVILGVSKSTIERNVLEPMREIYGDNLVGTINSDNTTILFGEKVYCLGAEKVSQVSKLRGASVKYCYCDELAEYNQEVFELLKSRLDKEYSVLDGALNPEHPGHWLKQFLDSDADVYVQTYTIFDNPFLSKDFIDNLCKEYKGTIYYDRYILGLWVNAEGTIYKIFANDPDKYKYKGNIEGLPKGDTVIGIDYGGTKSGQAFVCTRISNNYDKVVVLASQRITKELNAKELLEEQMKFIEYCRNKFKTEIDYIYPDNEESVHIRSLRDAVDDKGWRTIVRGSKKEPVNERIKLQLKLLAYDMFSYIDGECDSLVKAMSEALWNDKKDKDERLDNFTTDIDTMDAYEYSIERDMKRIIDSIEYKEG